MQMLVASFIAAVTISIALSALCAIVIAVLHFGGMFAYGTFMFLMFWAIAYIGLATYKEENEDDE